MAEYLRVFRHVGFFLDCGASNARGHQSEKGHVMSVATCSTIVGVFNERNDADRAIAELRQAEFRNDQIGVVTRDDQGQTVIKNEEEIETESREAVTVGTVAGAGIGGLVGLGVLVGAIPVIGPALAAGTLATILTNAAGGAVIAGLGGALMGWGVPEQHAKFYDGHFQAGRILVTVHTDDRCEQARAILERHGGFHHESVANSPMELQQAGSVD